MDAATPDIRIIFFDIDGTLIPIGERSVHPPVRDALFALHDRGVRLFVATGRAPWRLPDLSGIPFDGALCFNGAWCFDAGGLLHAVPMDPGDARAVMKNAEALGIHVAPGTAVRPGDSLEPGAPIYQITCRAARDMDARLVAGTTNVRAARWLEDAVDIIPANGGKARAMARILAHCGIAPSASMAFGDAGNDADMLAFAGIGVAMGNAAPAAVAAADHVTDPCEADGVLTALRHFHLI